ncbi:tetraacyldisaccharide 4'-kinase [Rickettsia typhi]|uniref:Tetraacyldisaccharide 4'-kinase n=2 Tax=Rickettsia typhi TaxID=785 RepID=LPXK_RICTY|nr:tetraacyldisaccharide 4'-kinase [Rickettsia typhi]P58188.1 RecName: Full=Tetraacyldisaccharide 4'-kinase; AltName: Full=Lipid A 4'-kinase [Rickettsia typhi str. Wilmington]AAU04164.1 Lipid-A 4prime-kinase [Rickettsia typhi str. Wilmington]AFE54541.1 tetraacyldisaccharide 4'-kinase [Rickettsia typhi str. TH1527]AFE55380.1 tetraacyldisaccharide 4'-kinase [Rickettsia typhi str. B9991CWPP]CAC33763.1 Tetraacyldisaccharide 4'-kinase [Rickettsia typhi str. Wilmington]
MIKLLYPQFWQERNIIAYLLLPISLIYQFLSYLRTSLACPVILPAKVICVGNCSVGGTGKTQIVIYLAKLLKAKNVSFVIITKAYGSNIKSTTIIQKWHTALEVGDEGIMLAKYGTAIAAKHIKDILPLINELKPDVIIVDDFLQNPYLHKDFTIVSVDSQRLFGNRFLIPAGPLRQNPKQVLDAADLIFLVSSNQDQIPNELTPYIDKVINAQIVPSNNIDKTKNYFAFSGIGNPQRFFLTLENYRLNIVGHKTFPDHYNYLQADLENLYSLAKEHNAILITTRKDYVKFNYLNNKIICLDVELSINNPDLLNEKIFKKA